MAISDKLKTLLDASRVPYTTAKHPVVYTAQEIAAAQHVPGRQLAKCVLVNTDQGPVLAVLSAICLVDLKRLKAHLRAKTLSIAKEDDIRRQFPDVEVGAMSPFGHLYQVPVIVDRGLSESAEIVFNAGSHTETVKMLYRDFATLAKSTTGAFAQPIGGPAKKPRAGASARKPRRRAAVKPKARAKKPAKRRAKRPRK